MAKIVLGIGTSHGPMLSTPPEQWDARVPADRKNKHPYRGETYGFDDLVRLRTPEKIGDQLGVDTWRDRHRRCREALDTLAQKFADAKIDAAIIVGNDQNEIFQSDLMPALYVFAGEEVFNEPSTEEQKAMMPPGIAISESGHKPLQRETYPCHAKLGRHMIESLIDGRFDVTQSSTLPQNGVAWASGMPHAFGFVYRKIMHDRVIPHIPVVVNTFYPPNQPRAGRCVALGDQLAKAVATWPEDMRIAVIASGGLSHFVIDEEFDRRFLDLLVAPDRDGIDKLPEKWLQSGTSEMKNWIPVATASASAGLRMEVVDYVPCYRSEAGTGNAMGFVVWQ
jgi:hypothetical protein